MNASRKTAITVGVLYIIGTVAGIPSLAFTGPIRNAQHQLVHVSANENKDSIHPQSISGQPTLLEPKHKGSYPIQGRILR
jgi:hypothetical protein